MTDPEGVFRGVAAGLAVIGGAGVVGVVVAWWYERMTRRKR